LEVPLAPVRTAAVFIHDRFDGPEVPLPGHPLILVDGDVAGVPIVGRTEDRIVGGDESHLDREPDRRVRTLRRLDHPRDRLRRVTARDRVLHLGETDQASAREDAIAAVHLGALRELRGDEPGQPRDTGGQAATRAGERPHHPVLEDHLLTELESRVPRLRRLVRPLALAEQGDLGVREDVELEVVRSVGQILQPLERLCERQRRVGAPDGKGGDGAQGQGRDDAERP
jgi:hypothetical protein